MGLFKSKHDLDLIDTTGNGSKWKEEIEKLSENIKINLVKRGNISYPWLMICKAEMNATQIEINETIPKYLPSTEKCGMVIFIVQEIDIKYKPYYADSRVKYITRVDHDFNYTYKMRRSLDGFNSEDWNRSDRNHYDGKWNNKGVPCQLRKRVHIKCITDLSKKAFSNFTARYIARIQPNWITEDESAEKGSLCIVVCFNLSRLQDEIDVVLQVTPQDCTTMLVVIQNCREGISPRPMLISNPSDNFNEFTNILYDDGECYDCDINYEARNKVQAFIDNN